MKRFAAILLIFLCVTPVCAAEPFALGSDASMTQAIASAHDVFAAAYVLPEDNYLTRALRSACARGAHVTLLLADPGYDASVSATNRTTIQSFASMAPSSTCRVSLATRPLHLKVVVTDQTVWLSDTNFSSSGYILGTTDAAVHDAISRTLADDRPHVSGNFATGKSLSLALEQRVLQASTQPLCISTESFSARAPIAPALVSALRRRQPVFVAVSPVEFRNNDDERAFVAELAQSARESGGSFHFTFNDRNEKFAIAGNDVAWVGSSNATSVDGEYGAQLDWGLLTTSSAIRAMVEQRCAELFRHK